MLTGSTGMASSMSLSCAWTPVTASINCGDPVRDTIARCSRESPADARPGPPPRRRRSARRAAVLLLVQRPCGGQVGRTRFDHPAEDEGIHQLGRGGLVQRPTSDPRRGRRGSTTVPPPRPRVVRTMFAARRAAIASRRVAGRPPSGRPVRAPAGARLPYGYTPRRIAVASRSTQPRTRAVPATRPAPPGRDAESDKHPQRSSSTSPLALVVCSSLAPAMKVSYPRLARSPPRCSPRRSPLRARS